MFLSLFLRKFNKLKTYIVIIIIMILYIFSLDTLSNLMCFLIKIKLNKLLLGIYIYVYICQYVIRTIPIYEIKLFLLNIFDF